MLAERFLRQAMARVHELEKQMRLKDEKMKDFEAAFLDI